MEKKIKVGLSACLAGDEVRYNKQGAADKFILGPLSQYFEYVKVCPEMAIGMGTPRETVRIVEKEGGVRLTNKEGSNDYTDKMLEFSKKSALDMSHQNLSGFIFKKGSPSCGAFRVKVYHESGHTLRNDQSGFYAQQIKEKMPWLPLEEEGRLNDAAIRHNFISRVFAMQYWRDNVESKMTANSLVDFHSRHKYMLMSYSQTGLRKLGRLVANKDKKPIGEVAYEYLMSFSELTSKPPTRRKHSNVLYHLIGYFTQMLDDYDRSELVKLVEKYRKGLLPLVLPVSSINHYVKKFEIKYLINQSYLEYPEDLCVLNKI